MKRKLAIIAITAPLWGLLALSFALGGWFGGLITAGLFSTLGLFIWGLEQLSPL